MYLIDAVTSLFGLQWRQQTPMFRPLPAHITRTFVKTATGDLELLICEPKSSTKPSHGAPPIFFAHGGCGSAGVWLEWMTRLHESGYPSALYAFSVRNHGASYTLPYWRMVYQTPFEDIQRDAMACLEAANAHALALDSTTRPPILVGHSSGGGVAQMLLSGSSAAGLRVKASGLCLVGSILSFGSYDLYWNWMKQDPWFPLRSLFHLQHPISPLSSEGLVHGAFFGRKLPRSQVSEFVRWMPAYESMGWPTGMFGHNFWGWAMGGSNTWLSCDDIIGGIEGVQTEGDKVCVMVGEEDMMYRSWMWDAQCDEYRAAIRRLKQEHKIEGKASTRTEGVVTEITEGGVRLVTVGSSGHHVQNDVYHENAADALRKWAEQV